MYEKAIELLPSTSSELSEVLRLWSKNEGRDAGESFDALFSAWQVKGFKDSTQGKLIIRLNERKSSLVEVVRLEEITVFFCFFLIFFCAKGPAIVSLDHHTLFSWTPWSSGER